jgi:peptide/nickel transport system substrate-binding protein
MTDLKVFLKSLPTRLRNFTVSFMTMLLALIPSSQAQNHSVSNPSHYGGTMVWGTINPPTIINPILTSHSVSAPLLELLFDPLIHINGQGRVIPGLAQSWDISKDGLVYTFHLRRHVYFHDGVECTAEDVKFTYEAIRALSNQSSWRTGTELVKEWHVLDPYAIEAKLVKPMPNLLFKLIREILPKHLYESTIIDANFRNYTPVGTGAFRFQSWDHTTNEITLTANHTYFAGRPFLDKVVVKTYQDNTALWAALMRGEVDLAMFLNHQDYEVLSKDSAFKTYQIPSGFYFAISYNIHDAILSDYELRHAISYAVDRKALMQRTGMYGVESNGPFYPQSPGFNKKVETVFYDPLKAQSMLMRRGWKLNNEGLFEKRGRPLVLTMLVNNKRQNYCQMALVLRQQLSEVGIGLKIVFYDDENQLTKDYLARVKSQMWLRMFLGKNDDPSEMADSWYSFTSQFGRLWEYHNPAMDRLFELGRTLEAGHNRDEVYQRIHALIDKDKVACFLFFPVDYHAVSARVKGTDSFFNNCYTPAYLLKDWNITYERRDVYGNY